MEESQLSRFEALRRKPYGEFPCKSESSLYGLRHDASKVSAIAADLSEITINGTRSNAILPSAFSRSLLRTLVTNAVYCEPMTSDTKLLLFGDFFEELRDLITPKLD